MTMTATHPRQPHPYDNPEGRQRFAAAELLSIFSFFLVLGGAIAGFGGHPVFGLTAMLIAISASYLARHLRRQAWDLTPGAAGRSSWNAPLNPARLIRPTTNSLLLGLLGFVLMDRAPDSGPLFVALATFTGVAIGMEVADLAVKALTRATQDWAYVFIALGAPVLVLTFVLIGEPRTTQGWALPYAITGVFLSAIASTAVNTLRPRR